MEKVQSRQPPALEHRLVRFLRQPGSEDPVPLVEALMGAGRTNDALEVVSAGLRAHADDGPLLLAEGQIHLRLGDLLRAQASLLKAARCLPGHAGPFRWLGEVLLKRGDPERAAKVLERAQSLDPHDEDVRRLLERSGRLARIAASGGQSVSARPEARAGAASPPAFAEEVSTNELTPPPAAASVPRPAVPAPPSTNGHPVDLSGDDDEDALTTQAPIPDELRSDELLMGPSAETLEGLGPGVEGTDGILALLRQEGIFEQPDDAPARWATETAGPRVSPKIRRALAIVWGLTLVLAVAGYFGWRFWLQQRQAKSAELVERAQREALGGDHEDLVDAERNLRVARDLDPHAKAVPELLLFVHAQRALEDGTFEPGYMRPTIARGEREKVAEAPLAAAQAVLAAAEGKFEAAKKSLGQALSAGADSAPTLYIAGRLEQRLGDPEALKHLSLALEREPSLAASAIALAEARVDDGRRDEAIEILDGLLNRDSDHLRASLMRMFVAADEAAPEAGLQAVTALAERIKGHGAATDVVLAELIRARLQRRQGKQEAARDAVKRAAEAGATEPRLLALVAAEARAVGSLVRAQTAATSAVAGAPTNRDFRKLLAEVLIERRDGVAALRTLGALPMEDPEVLRMSAQAALIVGGAEALEAASGALEQFVAAQEEPSVEMRALHIRTQVALGRAKDVLREAKALAESAPGDPAAARALGEAALGAKDTRLARGSLRTLVEVSPDDADAHYLRGRADRLAGEAEDAEKSFRRAVELLPQHVDANLALGRLLLDRGDYEGADRIYQDMARRSTHSSGTSTALLGRLGRVEALLGLGRLEDAVVQFDAIREKDRALPVSRITGGILALARGKPGEAVQQLQELASRENAAPDVLALYGDALFQAGETGAANDIYERALQRDSGLPEALLGKAEVNLRAEALLDVRYDLDDAERALKKRIRAPRLRARLLFLRGRMHQEGGRRGRDAAREALRAAVGIPGCPPDAWFFLGESLSGENSPGAREAYERYLELAPKGRFASRAERALR